MFVWYLLVLLLASILSAKSDNCPSSDKSQLATVRLRRHLLCDYDKYTRPVINRKETIILKIAFTLKYFQFNMHDNSFTLDSWMNMQWRDQHLIWKPDDYDSLEYIHMPINDIWIPDLSSYNKRNQGGEQSIAQSTTCIVENEGNVSCVPSVSLTTTCTHDLTKYPFDTHSCYVYLGSWVHTGEELKLSFFKPAIDTRDLVPNGEWKLLKSAYDVATRVYECCPNSTYPIMTIHFRIQRIAGAHIVSVILPAAALVTLTLTSLWISPDSSDRLNLCYLNFFAAFLYVQYVSSLVPMKADTIPLLLLFARDSLLLSAFTVIFSLVLKNMVKTEKSAPRWMSSILKILKSCKPSRLLFPRNSSFEIPMVESQCENEERLRIKEWMIFAKILDRLCFLIFLVLYLCMFIAFTP